MNVMSDCCSTDKKQVQDPKRCTCPENGKPYMQVPYATVLQHVKAPWQTHFREQAWYFCSDTNCDAVYFGADGTVISRSQLRTRVGIKEAADDAPICYCYGISRADALASPEAKAFVIEQTRQSNCACEIRNPSGRCCLKDFPK